MRPAKLLVEQHGDEERQHDEDRDAQHGEDPRGEHGPPERDGLRRAGREELGVVLQPHPRLVVAGTGPSCAATSTARTRSGSPTKRRNRIRYGARNNHGVTPHAHGSSWHGPAAARSARARAPRSAPTRSAVPVLMPRRLLPVRREQLVRPLRARVQRLARRRRAAEALLDRRCPASTRARRRSPGPAARPARRAPPRRAARLAPSFLKASDSRADLRAGTMPASRPVRRARSPSR